VASLRNSPPPKVCPSRSCSSLYEGRSWWFFLVEDYDLHFQWNHPPPHLPSSFIKIFHPKGFDFFFFFLGYLGTTLARMFACFTLNPPYLHCGPSVFPYCFSASRLLFPLKPQVPRSLFFQFRENTRRFFLHYGPIFPLCNSDNWPARPAHFPGSRRLVPLKLGPCSPARLRSHD